MAPNSVGPTGVLYEDDNALEKPDLVPVKELPGPEYKRVIVWKNIVQFGYFHSAALYGFYLIFTSAKVATTLFGIALYMAGMIGITAGAHRLWSHKAYKVKTPLKVLLLFLNTLAFQNSAYDWARDHRAHHKYSETNGDPHNSKRGFFFAHIGWLFLRKHPDVFSKGKFIDKSDLTEDKMLMFQHKYYKPLVLAITFVIPTLIPMIFWDETFSNSFHVATMFRYVITLNFIWFINSIAHRWGPRPYDKSIFPAENLVTSLFALGEGSHNYHHVFPWDYKADELGLYTTNFTTAFIDFFASIGWAYDLKTVSPTLIAARAKRTGDGSFKEVWGWGDKDLRQEDKRHATILKAEKSL